MKAMKKVLALALALAMVVTAVPVTSAEAANLTAGKSKKVTYYVGKTNTLTLTGVKASNVKSTTWSKNGSTAVNLKSKAKTSTKVEVVKAGTAKVTATVKLKSGKTKKYTCNITTKNPTLTVNQDSVKVVVGASETLSVKTAPASSTVTYASNDETIATVDKSGVITGVKTGSTVVTVRSECGTKTLTKSIIVTVGATNTVKGVEALNGAQLKVTFNEPVVTGLVDSTSITLKKDNTTIPFTGAWVDSNNKVEYVLTISSGSLKGDYVIATTADLKSATNTSFEPSSNKITVNDTVAPVIESTSYDLTGTKLTVVFSEPVIAPTTAVTTRTDNVAMTDSVSTDTTNARTASKSVVFTLNKAGSSYVDSNKNLNIKYTGVTDVCGNAASFDIAALYDLTEVAQATVTSVKRTSLDKITITFDKAVETQPTVSVNGTLSTVAMSSDRLSATATIASADQSKLSGSVIVSISGWKAYKCSTTAAAIVTTVDLAYTKVAAPVITSLQYIPKTDSTGAYFLATFDKEVTLASNGTATVTKILTNGIVGTDNISFTQTVNTSYPGATKDTAAKILLSTMPDADGTYTIVLPKDIATSADGEKNVATTFTLTLSGLTTSSTVKPGVTDVYQVGTSTIRVVFDKQVDISSASNVANYTLVGATVTEAKLISNTATSATVDLTVSVPNTAEYNVIISGVKAYNGGEMDMYTSNTMNLKDTVVPVITKAQITQVGDGSATDTQLTVTFSEAVTIDATSGALKFTADGKDYVLTTGAEITDAAKTVVFTVTNADGDKIQTTAGMLSGVVKADTNSAKIVDSTGVNTIATSTAVTVSAN